MVGNFRKGTVMAKKSSAVPENETKAERFKRVVTPRVNKAIKALRLVGNQSGSTYEYTPKQIENIGLALHKEVDTMIKQYASAGKADAGFTL